MKVYAMIQKSSIFIYLYWELNVVEMYSEGRNDYRSVLSGGDRKNKSIQSVMVYNYCM